MRIKKGFLLRKVLEDYVVVPVGAGSLDFDGMVTLNETGAFLWEALAEEKTEEELVEALTEQYEVTREQAQASTARFVRKLQEADFLV